MIIVFRIATISRVSRKNPINLELTLINKKIKFYLLYINPKLKSIYFFYKCIYFF